MATTNTNDIIFRFNKDGDKIHESPNSLNANSKNQGRLIVQVPFDDNTYIAEVTWVFPKGTKTISTTQEFDSVSQITIDDTIWYQWVKKIDDTITAGGSNNTTIGIKATSFFTGIAIDTIKTCSQVSIPITAGEVGTTSPIDPESGARLSADKRDRDPSELTPLTTLADEDVFTIYDTSTSGEKKITKANLEADITAEDKARLTTLEADVITNANDITTLETNVGVQQAKLDTIETGATADQTDSEIKTAYENNADTNAFTDSEKSKLASLESSKFLGTYLDLTALETAHPSPVDGSYGYVDGGIGENVITYIWDSTDNIYVAQSGGGTETPTTIKTKYESNADTNAYTDSEKSKVALVDQDVTIDSTPKFTDIEIDGEDSLKDYRTVEKGRNDVQDTQITALEQAVAVTGNVFQKTETPLQFTAVSTGALTKLDLNTLTVASNNTDKLTVDGSGDTIVVTDETDVNLTGNFNVISNETNPTSSISITFYLFNSTDTISIGNELDKVIVNGSGPLIEVDRSKSIILSASQLTTLGVPATLQVYYATTDDVDVINGQLSSLVLGATNPAPINADEITFDSSTTSITSTNVQGAIEESIQNIQETNNNTLLKLWSGTQAQYDLLTPDSNTIYYIEEV